MVVSTERNADSSQKAVARGARRRPKGEGTVMWKESRKRWLVRVFVPANEESGWDTPNAVSRYVRDPAKYEAAWPSAMGKRNAEAVRRQLLDEVRAGNHNKPSKAPKVDQRITLDAFAAGAWEAWLTANLRTPEAPKGKLSKRVAEEHRLIYATRIAPLLGTEKVTELVPSDADRLVAWLTSKAYAAYTSERRAREAKAKEAKRPSPGRALSAASARKAVGTLRTLVKVAEKDGLLPAGSHRNYEMPSGAVDRDTAVPTATPEQIAGLAETCLDASVLASNPSAVAMAIVATTGLRRSEVLALRWADCDLAAGTVTVTQGLTETMTGELVIGRTKSRNSNRTVPIPPALAEALREVRKRKPHTTYLAESSTLGVPTRPSQAARAGKRLLREHGVAEGGWHAVRHGLNEALESAGVNEAVRARLLGHTPEVNVKVYGGRHAAEVLAAGEVVADVLRMPQRPAGGAGEAV